jgi:hypothetical protein
VVHNRKIILRGEGITNDDGRRCLTNSNLNHALSNKISFTVTRNGCHTVTHVTHVTQNFPVHCPNEGLNFILSHLSEPVWPRTVSRWKTGYCKK